MSPSEPSAPPDFAAIVETFTDGWKAAMGIRFTQATKDEVSAELVVGPQHLQPLGIVHGGVHAGLVEGVASVGASLNVAEQGRFAVGLDNHTSFLHAVRGGKLVAIGRPVQRGRQTHLWEVNVRDDRGRVVATGRVRLLVIEQGSVLGGSKSALRE